MKFSNPDWNITTKISLLQRWIIVHSILYYELNTSTVADRMFDDNEHQLVHMQSEYPEDAAKSEYWYVFYDFDGSTGFHLYKRLNEDDKEWLMSIAKSLINE